MEGQEAIGGASVGYVRPRVSRSTAAIIALSLVLAAAPSCSYWQRGPAVRVERRSALVFRRPILAFATWNTNRSGLEMAVLHGPRERDATATVSVYRLERYAELGPVIASADVWLGAHNSATPPRITVGDPDGDAKAELVVSKGPLLEYDHGSLREEASRNEIVDALGQAGEKHPEWSSIFIMRTGYLRRDAILSLEQNNWMQGPLNTYELRKDGVLRRLATLGIASVQRPDYLGRIDDGPHDYFAGVWAERTLFHRLAPGPQRPTYVIRSEEVQLLASGRFLPGQRRQIFGFTYDDPAILPLMGRDTRPALWRLGSGGTKTIPVEGLEDSARLSSQRPAAAVDVNSDGLDEIMMVSRENPQEIVVYSSPR